jgi:adenine-specific DNA-methyltransferase
MLRSLEIKSLEAWKLELGLLPVPLFNLQNQNDKVILLNGRVGNFCLDLAPSDEDPRNLAWSSDVGHYVKIYDDIVEVYRWDGKPSSLERYKKKSVEENLVKFYDYLQKDQPSRDLSIISFAIKTFRTLRGVLGRDFDGQKSLRAFLYLLACTSEDVNRNELNLDKWGLCSDIQDIVNSVNSSDWESLIDSLRNGTSFYGLTPNISLLLRHASGTLFEEAHYETEAFDQSQLYLPGILPNPVSVKKETNFVGIYYTPPSIARTLVEETLNALGELPLRLKVFDPACGSGVFLKEVLRQLSLRNYSGSVELEGWDISPAAIDMAKFILFYEKDKLSDQFSLKININHQDSLDETKQWSNQADVILMNPPFVSWNKLSESQRDLVKKSLGSLMQKTPDLASVFLYKALQSLTSRGVIGCILPASILGAESYTKIRQAFISHLDIYLVGKLGSHHLFSNAQIDTAFLVGKSPKTSNSTLSLWADHRLESSSAVLRALRRYNYHGRDSFNIVDKKGFSIYENPSLSENLISWSPRSYSAFNLLKQLKQFSKAKDFFEIKEGVSTGLNAVFILAKKDVEKLPKRERKFFRPAITTESINESKLSDTSYVFYPYGENIPKIQLEDELRKYIETYYNDYLLPYKSKLVSRPRKTESNWWTLNEYRSWQVEKIPKLVSTHFGKVGSFAWDSSGNYVVINGFAWFPKKDKVLPESVGLAYLAILSCPFINNLLDSISNHIGGGQWDLSKRYVSNMPLPDLTIENLDLGILKSLHEIGKRINSGHDFDSHVLNDLVIDLYQLPDNTISLLDI